MIIVNLEVKGTFQVERVCIAEWPGRISMDSCAHVVAGLAWCKTLRALDGTCSHQLIPPWWSADHENVWSLSACFNSRVGKFRERVLQNHTICTWSIGIVTLFCLTYWPARPVISRVHTHTSTVYNSIPLCQHYLMRMQPDCCHYRYSFPGSFKMTLYPPDKCRSLAS